MSRLPEARSRNQREIELFAGRILTSPELRQEFLSNPEGTIMRYFSNPELMLETLGRERLPRLRDLVDMIHRREEEEDIPPHEEAQTCWINFSRKIG